MSRWCRVPLAVVGLAVGLVLAAWAWAADRMHSSPYLESLPTVVPGCLEDVDEDYLPLYTRKENPDD